jgi:hypothetical protein
LFVKRTIKNRHGKTYINHLLVESVATERGPRHRVVCSLGALAPGPKRQWLKLAHELQEALSGQESLLGASAQGRALKQKVTAGAGRSRHAAGGGEIDLEGVEVEQARQAGAVHVAHQFWQRLGLDEILARSRFEP